MLLFLFVFFLCCLFPFQTINLYNVVSVLSGFSLLKTGLSGFCCLHLVVFFPFLLSCFEVYLFSFPSKKPPKKPDTAKAQKMQKKRAFFQLAQLCSQIVFLCFRGGLKNADFCWKHNKIVVSACSWRRNYYKMNPLTIFLCNGGHYTNSTNSPGNILV